MQESSLDVVLLLLLLLVLPVRGVVLGVRVLFVVVVVDGAEFVLVVVVEKLAAAAAAVLPFHGGESPRHGNLRRCMEYHCNNLTCICWTCNGVKS